MARSTWSRPDGSWGLIGVEDLTTPICNPRVYTALARLRDTENLIDILNNPQTTSLQREAAIRELLTMGSDQTGGDGDGSHMDL